MQNSLMHIIYRTTQHVSDFRNFQADDSNEGKQQLLVELVQMLFEQFKAVAQMHSISLKCFAKAAKAHNIQLDLYDMNFYWIQVQNVVCRNYMNNLMYIQIHVSVTIAFE